MSIQRVAVFASVSSPAQATIDKDSLPSQIRDGQAWAEENGWQVVRVYKVPGHTRKFIFYQDAEQGVPAYRELRQDCEERVFDVLWCRARDRLGRTDALIAQVEALVAQADAEVYSALVPHQVGQTSEASTIFLSAIERAQAQTESIARIIRTSVGMKARTRRGLPPSNWPHGYRVVKDGAGKTIGGEFVTGEIEAVRVATRLFLAGHGYYAIVQALNESDWKPRRSARWGYATVHQWMNNDFYAGLVTYGDTQSAEPSEHFPALWDAETYQAVVRERQRRQRGGSAPVSPASGVVICNRCGWSMGAALAGRRRIFRCSKHQRAYATGVKCHYNCIDEDVVIETLEEALAKFARMPEVMEAALQEALPSRAALENAVKAAQREVDAIKEKMHRLALAVAEGAIDANAARVVNDQLSAALDGAMDRLRSASIALTTLPSQEAQRQYMAELIAQPDLRAEPLEVMRAKLQRAGVRVYVEDRQIVRVVFGGPCTG